MQKKDLEIVNAELSKISDKILKVLEILQDEKLTHKQARKMQSVKLIIYYMKFQFLWR